MIPVSRGNRRVEIREADRCYLQPGCFELSLVVAQLRDVLAAEHSAIVAQENHQRGALTQSEPSWMSSPSGFGSEIGESREARVGLMPRFYRAGWGAEGGLGAAG